MSRYILRFKGQGEKPVDALAHIEQKGSIRVLDDSSPRMLLVDGPDEDVEDLTQELSDWIAIPEETFPLPDTRLRVERPDSGESETSGESEPTQENEEPPSNPASGPS